MMELVAWKRRTVVGWVVGKEREIMEIGMKAALVGSWIEVLNVKILHHLCYLLSGTHIVVSKFCRFGAAAGPTEGKEHPEPTVKTQVASHWCPL